MKLVFDSSVALKTVVPEDDSDKAIAIIEGNHELIAPDIFPMECAHVLSKAVRQNRMSEEEARKALESILDTRPAMKLSMRLLPAAYDISLQARCSLWDALYVAMADREKCQLVTADEKLVNNLQSTYSFLLLLSSFPTK